VRKNREYCIVRPPSGAARDVAPEWRALPPPLDTTGGLSPTERSITGATHRARSEFPATPSGDAFRSSQRTTWRIRDGATLAVLHLDVIAPDLVSLKDL